MSLLPIINGTKNDRFGIIIMKGKMKRTPIKRKTQTARKR